MSSDPYSDLVRALFADPSHAGTVDDGVAARLDDQGARVELTAGVDDDVVKALRFRAWGCPHVLAAAEAFCRDYEGRPVSDLGAFRASELMQSLPVPREKMGRILVLEDTVHALGQSLRDRPDPGRE